jgi:competence protein ComGC
MPISPLHKLKKNKNITTMLGILAIVAVLFFVTIIKVTTQQ